MILTQNSAPKVSIIMRWRSDNTFALDKQVLTIQAIKNGGVPRVITRAVTPLGYGVYSIHLLAEDTSTEGELVLICVSSSAESTTSYKVEEDPAKKIWNTPITTITDKTTVGGYVSKLLMTLRKYVSLVDNP